MIIRFLLSSHFFSPFFPVLSWKFVTSPFFFSPNLFTRLSFVLVCVCLMLIIIVLASEVRFLFALEKRRPSR